MPRVLSKKVDLLAWISMLFTRSHDHTRADGRVVYDEEEILFSPEARKHYDELDRLAKKGMI